MRKENRNILTELKREYLAAGKFDFLDFGASKSASIEYGKAHFFGKRGLGIDLDAERVSATNKAGYDCVVGDITKIKIPKKCVRFVKMAHILEHMPDIKAIESVIKLAEKSATDFLVITGPFFDEDKYLAAEGFKLHWSDYPDHPYHLKVSELVNILNKLKLDNYEIFLRFPIDDSSNQHIHPLNSPPHSHQYDAKIHPPKKHIVFARDIWTDFVCYVQLRRVENWMEITKAYKNQIPYIEQKETMKYVWPRKAVRRYVELDTQNQLLEQEVHELKTKLATTQKKLTDIKNSNSWKIARITQKTSHA